MGAGPGYITGTVKKGVPRLKEGIELFKLPALPEMRLQTIEKPA
jgi:hypothetical protein